MVVEASGRVVVVEGSGTVVVVVVVAGVVGPGADVVLVAGTDEPGEVDDVAPLTGGPPGVPVWFAEPGMVVVEIPGTANGNVVGSEGIVDPLTWTGKTTGAVGEPFEPGIRPATHPASAATARPAPTHMARMVIPEKAFASQGRPVRGCRGALARTRRLGDGADADRCSASFLAKVLGSRCRPFGSNGCGMHFLPPPAAPGRRTYVAPQRMSTVGNNCQGKGPRAPTLAS